MSRLVRRTPVIVLIALASRLSSAQAQTASGGDEPKLSETLSFTLGPQRERVARQVLESIVQIDEQRRVRELNAENATILSRGIDLLRFVPFKLSNCSGNMDEFFTPNYLRPGYNEQAAETHLFE